MHRKWYYTGKSSRRNKNNKILCEQSDKKPEGVINPKFVQMMEALGYDIEMIYIKRKDEERS